VKKISVGTLETWAMPQTRGRGVFSSLRDRLARRKYAHDRIHSDVGYLREFMKQRGPFDVVWAPNEAPDGLVVAMAGKRGVKLPPVLVQVNAMRLRFRKKAPIVIAKTPLRLVFRRAARLLAASDMLADAMGAYAGAGLKKESLREKTKVVHPALRREFARAAFDRSLVGPWPDRVLYLGELDPQGGALVFMKALLKTATAQRTSTFVVAGDFVPGVGRGFAKRWEKAQEAVAAELASARTEYLGHVSTYEVIRQIKMAQIVVIPALFSSFSRSLIEALALGRPVVTTDQVGAWGIVQNYGCGRVVPSYNSTALAAAIDEVIAEDLPFVTNAQRISEQLISDFSPEMIAEQVAQHLSEIAVAAK